jgi:hypothetical protein
MFVQIVFSAVILFILVYYSAFEYSRYKTARLLAARLGGRAVFRIGGSYMRRENDGVEERVWIAPDDRIAWGSILTVLRPPSGVLLLRRRSDPGFRFHIEAKTGVLYRTILPPGLKETEFNVKRLDERLRVRTDDATQASFYFSVPERQLGVIALFLDGFTLVKGDRRGVTATMKDVSAEDLGPEKIDLYLGQLRNF